MYLLPMDSIVTGEDDDRGRGVNEVAIGAATEGEIEPISESYEIRESVVFAIVKDSSNLGNLYIRRQLGSDGRQDKSRDQNNSQTPFHVGRVGGTRYERSSSRFPY